MEQIKLKGGKRKGAGRKPVIDKKKQISLYVETKKILKFGSEDKMKEFLYRQIDGFGDTPQTNSGAPKPVDNSRNIKEPVIHSNEAETPLKSPITGLPPKLSAYDGFMDELKNATTIHQIENIMKRAKGEIMFPKERLSLENYAKEVSKEMFND